MSLIQIKNECKKTNRLITYIIASSIILAITIAITLAYISTIPTLLILMSKTSAAWIA